MKGVISMSDVTTETKSAAAAFLNTHEKLVDDLAAARSLIDDQDKQLAAAHNKIELLQEQVKETRASERRYLSYAVDLAGNLRFMSAGVIRALRTAGTIEGLLADEHASIQDVPGADIKVLEDLMQRLGNVLEDKPSTTTQQSLAAE